MLLSIVSDGELFVSQTVKAILIVILLSSIGFNVFRYLKREDKKGRYTNIIAIALILFVTVIVVGAFIKERDLYKNPSYTTGTTVGEGSIFLLGPAVEFEYVVDGVTYKNKNTFHPVPKDSIVAEGGTYQVRYSKKYPKKGRLDFRIKQ